MKSCQSNSFTVSHRARLVCIVAISVIAVSVSPTMAVAQTNTQRGATFGGITGAIAGAIIGDNNDEAGAGAAIGGALGAVAGGILGNANDKDAARRQYYYQSRPQTVAPTYVQPVQPVPTGAVSFNDVVAMSRSGVGQSVILNQIQTRGVQRQPVVSDIISLHQQGVPEHVIAAMQQAPVGNQIVASAPTTIVETPVYVQPPVAYPVPVYRGHRGPVYRARPSYHIRYGR